MIFVTTGTHYLPFDRLLKITDFLIKNNEKREKVVIQSGSSKIIVSGAEIIPYLSYQQTIDYISRARIVITSAGPATIFQVLIFGKSLPLVVPRMKKYGEHVSDHQVFFAKYLKEKKLCKLIFFKEDLLFACKAKTEKAKKLVLSSSVLLIKKLKKHINEKF